MRCTESTASIRPAYFAAAVVIAKSESAMMGAGRISASPTA